MKLPAQVVAIAGKSEELKAKLEKLAKRAHATGGGVRIYPIGYTRQMDEYMAAADILLSKPGVDHQRGDGPRPADVRGQSDTGAGGAE